MPCSAVTVDYHRDSPAMPVTLSRNLLDSQYSIKQYTSNSSSTCPRRTPASSPSVVPDIVQKYATSRWDFSTYFIHRCMLFLLCLFNFLKQIIDLISIEGGFHTTSNFGDVWCIYFFTATFGNSRPLWLKWAKI